MRKNESRIKLLISGLLLLTALLIIILTYFSPASLQNNQFQKEDSQNVYNDSSDKKNDPGISKKRDPNILSKKNTNIDNSTENRTENYTENNIENKNLFSEKSSKSARAAARANSSVSGKNKVLYFIIDDAGYNLEKLKPFLDFPGDLTIAVLPGLTYSKQSAALAIKKGKKVILHQPMESVNGNDTGPHAIKMGMQENEIIEILEHNISSISGIIGMNNHMGSAVTTDERIMKIILKYLYNKTFSLLTA